MWKRSGLMARYANFQSLITSHLVNEQIHFKLAKRMRRCLLGIRLKLKSPHKLHWEFLFSPDFIGKWACEMTLGIFHRPTSLWKYSKHLQCGAIKQVCAKLNIFPGPNFIFWRGIYVQNLWLDRGNLQVLSLFSYVLFPTFKAKQRFGENTTPCETVRYTHAICLLSHILLIMHWADARMSTVSSGYFHLPGRKTDRNR